MRYKFQKKIGNTVYEFSNEVKGEMDFIKEVSFYAQMPEKCRFCGSGDLFPKYRTPKDYEYFSIGCRGCQAELKFGQSKQKEGALFIKDWDQKNQTPQADAYTDDPSWRPAQTTRSQIKPNPEPAQSDWTEENIPF